MKSLVVVARYRCSLSLLAIIARCRRSLWLHAVVACCCRSLPPLIFIARSRRSYISLAAGAHASPLALIRDNLLTLLHQAKPKPYVHITTCAQHEPGEMPWAKGSNSDVAGLGTVSLFSPDARIQLQLYRCKPVET